jgi:carbon storage regulator
LEFASVLVLSRRVGEQLIIGDGQITITVLAVSGGTVRLGIEAPRDVAVNRGEILAALKREGRLDVRDGRRGKASIARLHAA